MTHTPHANPEVARLTKVYRRMKAGPIKRGPEKLIPVLGAEELDQLAAEKVSLSLLKKERKLYGSKWFDYRLVNPAQATVEFADAYRKAYSDAMKRRNGPSGAFQTGLPREHLFQMKQRAITSVWKARQAADALGAPYDWFCLMAMSFAEERNFEFMPPPAHLANEEFTEMLTNAWAVECRIRMRCSNNPFFKSGQFMDHPDQIAHETFVVNQIKSRTHPDFALHTALVIHMSLSQERAYEEFGRPMCRRAFSMF